MHASRSIRGLAAAGCAVALAACGSSGNSSNTSGVPAGVKFSNCMRTHGVPNFPDQQGGGIKIPDNSGINPRSPAFQAAQSACFKLLPGGGPGRAGVSEARKQAMLKLAECMRSHGISAFPDPSSAPPSAPPAGGGIAFGAPGSFIAVPETMIQSPGFKQAGAACGFPGFGGDKGPKP